MVKVVREKSVTSVVLSTDQLLKSFAKFSPHLTVGRLSTQRWSVGDPTLQRDGNTLRVFFKVFILGQ